MCGHMGHYQCINHWRIAQKKERLQNEKHLPPQCFLCKREHLVEHILLMDEYVQRKSLVVDVVESSNSHVTDQEDQLNWCPES